MGLAFASRRTWVETDLLGLILSEDDYKQLVDSSQAQIGDLVIYRSGSDRSVTHVGIILSRVPGMGSTSWMFLVMSKWGQEGEYIHPISEVPVLLGIPSEYWTDRT
jgi:cell wall-associated NlpC family hydrolase